MRKHLSISWVLASDAACFIGGLLAGAVAIHLLQSAPLPNATGSLWEVVQPSFEGVNRAGKADRGDLIPFAERFGALLGAAAHEMRPASPDEHSGRVLLQVDPAANTTTVPKGEVSSGRPPGSTGELAEKPQGARPEPSLIKAVGCEFGRKPAGRAAPCSICGALPHPGIASHRQRAVMTVAPRMTIDTREVRIPPIGLAGTLRMPS